MNPNIACSKDRITLTCISPRLWDGSSLGVEDSFHQIAPFVGKMKTTMAGALIQAFSRPGETVLDPFCGSGAIPYEALLRGRHAMGSDINPYSVVITRAKLSPSMTEETALNRAQHFITIAERSASLVNLAEVPRWVRQFFHPQTLKEIVALVSILRCQEQWFLLGCLLGILHHVRPGFLSYPASHLTPYLRNVKYSRKQFPEMYKYRDVRSRLLAKIGRVYRRHADIPAGVHGTVLIQDARRLDIADESIEAIVTSPPYFDALDYGRDNRLRLWFLGVQNYKMLDRILFSEPNSYLDNMADTLLEMHRVLRPGGHCILVLGDVCKNGHNKPTAELIANLVSSLGVSFACRGIIADEIPDIRRSRRGTRTTRNDKILVLRKKRPRSSAHKRQSKLTKWH